MSLREKLRRSVKSVLITERGLRDFLSKDKECAIHVSVLNKFQLWRRGFFGGSSVIYNREPDQLHDFLSDYARLVRSRRINAEKAVFLDNKLLFETCFRDYL